MSCGDEATEDQTRADAAHDAREDGAPVGVELAVHREVLGVHDGDVHPSGEQAAGGLETEQPTAEHHCGGS